MNTIFCLLCTLYTVHGKVKSTASAMMKLCGGLLARKQLLGKLQQQQQQVAHRCFSLFDTRLSGFATRATVSHAYVELLQPSCSSTPRLFSTLSSVPPPPGTLPPAKTATGRKSGGARHKKPPSSPVTQNEQRQRQLHNQIKQIFGGQGSRASDIDKLALSGFILNQTTHMDKSNLVSLFYNLGKSNSRVSRKLVHPFVSALAKANNKRRGLTAATWHDALTHNDIGKIFFSLKSFDSRSQEILLLAKTLTYSIRDLRTDLALDSPMSPLSAMTVASICSGIQHLPCGSKHPEVAALLQELSRFFFLGSKSTSEEGAMTSRAIGTAFFGLKSQSSRCPSALTLLDSLVALVQARPSCRMQGGHIAQALLGLKGMHSEHQEVKRALLVLAGNMMPDADAAATGGAELGGATGLLMNPKEVSMSLHSLMNKNSFEREVRAVVRGLTAVLLQEQEQQCFLDSAATGISLYGLRHMRSEQSVSIIVYII